MLKCSSQSEAPTNSGCFLLYLETATIHYSECSLGTETKHNLLEKAAVKQKAHFIRSRFRDSCLLGKFAVAVCLANLAHCTEMTPLSFYGRHQLTKYFVLFKKGIIFYSHYQRGKNTGFDIHSDFFHICKTMCFDLKRRQVTSWWTWLWEQISSASDGLLASVGEKTGFDGSPRKSIMANECWWQLYKFRATDFLCFNKDSAWSETTSASFNFGHLIEQLCVTIELQRGFFHPSALK